MLYFIARVLSAVAVVEAGVTRPLGPLPYAGCSLLLSIKKSHFLPARQRNRWKLPLDSEATHTNTHVDN